MTSTNTTQENHKQHARYQINNISGVNFKWFSPESEFDPLHPVKQHWHRFKLKGHNFKLHRQNRYKDSHWVIWKLIWCIFNTHIIINDELTWLDRCKQMTHWCPSETILYYKFTILDIRHPTNIRNIILAIISDILWFLSNFDEIWWCYLNLDFNIIPLNVESPNLLRAEKKDNMITWGYKEDEPVHGLPDRGVVVVE